MSLEIHPNRAKVVWMAVTSAVFVIAGIFMALDSTVDLLHRIVMGFGVVFFGVCFYFLVRKALDKRPSLTIGQAGILDNTSALQVGLIAWEDIKALQIITYSRQLYLAIEVHRPDKYLGTMNPIARRAASMNQKLVGYSILFPQAGLAMPLDEVIVHIEQRFGRTATRRPAAIQTHLAQTVIELLL